MDLSVVIPARGEGPNLESLLPSLRTALDALSLTSEIFVVAADTDSSVARVARETGSRVIVQVKPGYGGALRAGFATASGDWILTMDADQSHPPDFIAAMWQARALADVVIASRYVPGGRAVMPVGRYLLSRTLNVAFSRGLSLNVADMSSGYRLYRRAALPAAGSLPQNFDVVQALLVRAYCEGWRVMDSIRVPAAAPRPVHRTRPPLRGRLRTNVLRALEVAQLDRVSRLRREGTRQCYSPAALLAALALSAHNPTH